MASIQPKNGRLYVRYRDLDGVQRTVAAGTSEKEANKLRAQIEEWLAEGIDPNRSMATFKQVTEAFFQEHVIPNCAWNTMRDYLSAFEKYHLRRWSRTPIRSISKYDYKRARDALATTDITHKRVNNLMAPLNKMFSWATDEGYISENVALGLKPLKTTHEEMLYFTPEQLNELVEACDVADGFYRPHLLFLGWTGLRIGELQELRFKDISWDMGNPCIHVQRALKDGRNLVGLPKSGKKRWVGVPSHIADVLRQQQALLETNDEDLVFPNHNGLRLDAANFRQRVFHRTLVKLGWREATGRKPRPKNGEGVRKGRGFCPRKKVTTPTIEGASPLPAPPSKQDYRVHDLRHTFAYIFLNRGRDEDGSGDADIYALKETMGHAQITTTMKYSHFAEDDADRVADTMDRAWKNTKGTQNLNEKASSADDPSE